jgi:hypothetical protein
MLALNMFFLRAGRGFGLEPGWANTTPVTVVRKRYSKSRSTWTIIYHVSGDSGYVLNTRLRTIESIHCLDAKITNVSHQDGIITFVASAAFTSARVVVTGH